MLTDIYGWISDEECIIQYILKNGSIGVETDNEGQD
jgi:hypothetical protein